MRHDTKKVNSFIRYIDGCQAGTPYGDMLNGWMGETGGRVSDAEELRYYISLIPAALKRKKARAARARCDVQTTAKN